MRALFGTAGAIRVELEAMANRNGLKVSKANSGVHLSERAKHFIIRGQGPDGCNLS